MYVFIAMKGPASLSGSQACCRNTQSVGEWHSLSKCCGCGIPWQRCSCDAWSTHESMSCWPSQETTGTPGPARCLDGFVLSPADAALCSWALWSCQAAAPAHPCRGTPWHTLGIGPLAESHFSASSPLAHGPHGGLSRAENISCCCSWRENPSHRNDDICKLILWRDGS